ncbi:hypothetical protein MSG28_015733 [Choristoneura fumiferana]|uniref:Uncharacterized protein n=1 Tax=Choristoneura fumiferana TaxID=7141 RepID=A0ACC0KC42_CHOFU|nr:hypothetical protein MSG28_015733 [Choristoneura fumiferana]
MPVGSVSTRGVRGCGASNVFFMNQYRFIYLASLRSAVSTRAVLCEARRQLLNDDLSLIVRNTVAGLASSCFTSIFCESVVLPRSSPPIRTANQELATVVGPCARSARIATTILLANPAVKQQCLHCCVSAWRARQPVKLLALENFWKDHHCQEECAARNLAERSGKSGVISKILLADPSNVILYLSGRFKMAAANTVACATNPAATESLTGFMVLGFSSAQIGSGTSQIFHLREQFRAVIGQFPVRLRGQLAKSAAQESDDKELCSISFSGGIISSLRLLYEQKYPPCIWNTKVLLLKQSEVVGPCARSDRIATTILLANPAVKQQCLHCCVSAWRDYTNVNPLINDKQRQYEVNAGSKTDLMENKHYYYPSHYSDLSRRFVPVYPYEEKTKSLDEDDALASLKELIQASQLQTESVDKEAAKLIPVRAPPELVIAIAKQSAKVKRPTPSIPTEKVLRNNILRSGLVKNWSLHASDSNGRGTGHPDALPPCTEGCWSCWRGAAAGTRRLRMIAWKPSVRASADIPDALQRLSSPNSILKALLYWTRRALQALLLNAYSNSNLKNY